MSSLRVSGGELRGRRIPLPRDHELRPTSDRARQAFFNIIREEVEGSRFLDLFSGTGIFSFEALSRGAAAATAVEKASRAVEQIRATATTLGVELSVVAGDVMGIVPRLDAAKQFTVVYADPPYGFDRYAELLTTIAGSPAIADGALVAVEHATGKTTLPAATDGLRFRREARYGSITIALFDKGAGD